MATITLQIDEDTQRRLEYLAAATSCSETSLAIRALRTYLETYDWQSRGIERALEEAEASQPQELVPHDRVRRWLHSWGTKEELEPPR